MGKLNPQKLGLEALKSLERARSGKHESVDIKNEMTALNVYAKALTSVHNERELDFRIEESKRRTIERQQRAAAAPLPEAPIHFMRDTSKDAAVKKR